MARYTGARKAKDQSSLDERDGSIVSQETRQGGQGIIRQRGSRPCQGAGASLSASVRTQETLHHIHRLRQRRVCGTNETELTGTRWILQSIRGSRQKGGTENGQSSETELSQDTGSSQSWS